MGWSIGYDNNWKRDIGYGVPAYCDAPKCIKEIDRGLGYVCGGEPYSGERGCGLFFCSEYLYCSFKCNQLCNRCINYKSPYKKISPEHPRWIKWKLKDKSWAIWRKENPDEVTELKKLLGIKS